MKQKITAIRDEFLSNDYYGICKVSENRKEIVHIKLNCKRNLETAKK